MYWRFGGYANISAIETILDKEEFQLEELLDENDLIQELKSHNSKLIEYLRETWILEKLLGYVVAPRLAPIAPLDDEKGTKGKEVSLPCAQPRASPRATDVGSEEEEAEKKRNRYAFISSELLASDNWSIYESLMESKKLLSDFWQFLKRPAPLDSLQASYFTKVNESLFDKKMEDMLDWLKTLDSPVADMVKHVDSPMIMDLLLKIISLERTESGQGIVEWLYSQDMMPTLMSFLGPEHSWTTQTSAGDFMKAIITVSANASQNEHTCIGPNELTRQLVSKPCVEQLIKYMLRGGNPLTVGVGIVIEVIRKNNSDYDPDGVETGAAPSNRDPIYLGTLLRLFARHVPDFMALVMNAPAQKARLDSTFGGKIEPLGFDRFKTCELMAELLHCSNMGLLNEPGAEELIAARDLERARLRVEGRLVPLRGENNMVLSEGLTMRLSHPSACDGGRKLEVTNSSAEDDGFEEVTHSGEDDASHGVVELPEIPTHDLAQGPASTFLNKDDDDFVDEPLTSPRLHACELGSSDEDQSSDSDLNVPPLSPTKQSPSQSVTGEQEEKKKDGSKDYTSPAEDAPDNAEEAIQGEAASVPEAGKENKAEDWSESKLATRESMSPRPEDTPAPLFSGQASVPTVSVSEMKQQSAADDDIQLPNFVPEMAESVAFDLPSVPTAPASDSGANLVVGDYLKLQFVEHHVVPTILGFFFTYAWNNFLHNVVYDIVQQVFNGPMDRGFNPTLAISLFEKTDITAQIVNGQFISELSQTLNKTRMGYMGHLTLIAEEVVKFTERNSPELLSETVLDKVMATAWVNYVEGALAETRERDNAILGGARPEVAMSSRSGAGLSGLSSLGLGGGGGSTSLAEAGLNVTSGGQETPDNSGSVGIGPFGISSGTTLTSGFGSSSDEDDDEAQESEENAHSEFKAYTDPLIANKSSSLNPPCVPPPLPPPPPLNIPPSRARLQLAARLAMNKRNAAAAVAAAASNGQDDGALDDDEGRAEGALLTLHKFSEGQRNPFADDGDADGPNSSRGKNGQQGGQGGAEDDAAVGSGSGAPTSGGWHRGTWWRGVVRSAKRRGRNGESKEKAAEHFGHGRDDSSDDSDEGHSFDDDDMADEEFGDFAVPETIILDTGTSAAKGGDSAASASRPGQDQKRHHTGILKPLAVHPTNLGSRTASNPFSSLWPFGSSPNKEKKDDRESGNSTDAEKVSLGMQRGNGDVAAVIDEKTVSSEAPVEVVGEDGHRIEQAVEAKRRTSIEDPDEDDDISEVPIVVRGGRS